MQLVVYGPEHRLGALHDEHVIDLNAAYAKFLREKRDEPPIRLPSRSGRSCRGGRIGRTDVSFLSFI